MMNEGRRKASDEAEEWGKKNEIKKKEKKNKKREGKKESQSFLETSTAFPRLGAMQQVIFMYTGR